MEILKIISKNYSKILLALIFLIALTLRWWYLPAKAIFFSFDQARDVFVIKELLGGHLKILGPPVSGIPGLFHGVLYYYVIAPAYFFGKGSPIAVSYWMSFLNALGIFVVYLLTYVLTKKKVPSLFAALIYASSFEATQYSNLLTNASMAEWFVPLFFIGLYLWITKSWKLAPILTGLGLGFAIQSEVATSYIIIPLIIWLVIFRKNVTRKQVFMFIVSLLIAISTMIISEIKFGFTGASGLLYLFSSQDRITQSVQFGDFIIHFLNQNGETFSNTLFPLNAVFGGLIGFFFIFYSLVDDSRTQEKNTVSWTKFLAIYIFAYLLALPFGGSNMRHIMVGATAGISALVGIFIWKYLGNNKIICLAVLGIIFSSNIYKTIKEDIRGQTIFSLNSDLILSTETQVLDYVYLKADGQPFSISTLTSPLFINTTWSYLFNWYGKGKYGYLPYWIGRDQVGQPGDDLRSPPVSVKEHFFISESTFGIPEQYVTYAKGDQDAISTFVSQKNFGEIVVQERKMK